MRLNKIYLNLILESNTGDGDGSRTPPVQTQPEGTPSIQKDQKERAPVFDTMPTWSDDRFRDLIDNDDRWRFLQIGKDWEYLGYHPGYGHYYRVVGRYNYYVIVDDDTGQMYITQKTKNWGDDYGIDLNSMEKPEYGMYDSDGDGTFDSYFDDIPEFRYIRGKLQIFDPIIGQYRDPTAEELRRMGDSFKEEWYRSHPNHNYQNHPSQEYLDDWAEYLEDLINGNSDHNPLLYDNTGKPRTIDYWERHRLPWRQNKWYLIIPQELRPVQPKAPRHRSPRDPIPRWEIRP